MKLASVLSEYYDVFLARYNDMVLPSHMAALDRIRHCRTPEAGEFFVGCSDCNHTDWRPVSCGHRHCPQCQNHEGSQWIDRQQNKLLPVQYFMVTFTLPCEFRAVTYRHQKIIYAILFSCIADILKDFARNPRHLGAEIGMTMVLHTHNRKLDFHPHVHVVVPGGGVDKLRRQWKKKKGRYLFNHKALAKVFRARFLDAMNNAGLPIPKGVRPKWVVDCTNVGKGITALKYLSRYLYRGVISEKNIVSNENGLVTFKYVESKTGKIRYRTLKGEAFLHLIMHHVLPKGFRRVRDYGFLHSNAKKLLFLVQLVLHVKINKSKLRPRPVFRCPCCKSPMKIIGFRPAGWVPI